MGLCEADSSDTTAEGVPVIGSLTLQHLLQIISYACLGATACLWLGLAVPHLRRYRAPDEQRPIFRIITTPLVFAAVALASVHAYEIAQYLEPISNLYEAYALVSLFLLYVHYVVPEPHTRDEFFRNLQTVSKSGQQVAEGSIRWFRVSKMTVN